MCNNISNASLVHYNYWCAYYPDTCHGHSSIRITLDTRHEFCIRNFGDGRFARVLVKYFGRPATIVETLETASDFKIGVVLSNFFTTPSLIINSSNLIILSGSTYRELRGLLDIRFHSSHIQKISFLTHDQRQTNHQTLRTHSHSISKMKEYCLYQIPYIRYTFKRLKFNIRENTKDFIPHTFLIIDICDIRFHSSHIQKISFLTHDIRFHSSHMIRCKLTIKHYAHTPTDIRFHSSHIQKFSFLTHTKYNITHWDQRQTNHQTLRTHSHNIRFHSSHIQKFSLLTHTKYTILLDKNDI
ncbi:hypothetical protein AGLY_015410 [Aphis glycines]|uniref:Uncharacterized protein n=1 Tax=Aphis glycines TaxID=307491 RepID=A0A6G0T1D9_APHGL|nr:hypothetical protein AGLY_015410 [Aphis glycines]